MQKHPSDQQAILRSQKIDNSAAMCEQTENTHFLG